MILFARDRSAVGLRLVSQLLLAVNVGCRKLSSCTYCLAPFRKFRKKYERNDWQMTDIAWECSQPVCHLSVISKWLCKRRWNPFRRKRIWNRARAVYPHLEYITPAATSKASKRFWKNDRQMTDIAWQCSPRICHLSVISKWLCKRRWNPFRRNSIWNRARVVYPHLEEAPFRNHAPVVYPHLEYTYLPPLAYIMPAPTLTQNRNAANVESCRRAHVVYPNFESFERCWKNDRQMTDIAWQCSPRICHLSVILKWRCKRRWNPFRRN